MPIPIVKAADGTVYGIPRPSLADLLPPEPRRSCLGNVAGEYCDECRERTSKPRRVVA